MSQSSLIEAVKPEKPDREFWRNCASEFGGGDWFAVRRNGKLAVVSIFGDICFGENFDRLIREIGDADGIKLEINCAGGDSVAALAFGETFAGRIIEARIYQRAFSSGYFIAMGAAKIVMAKDAKLLLHAPASFGYGSAEELLHLARMLARTTAQIAERLRERTELEPDVIAGLLDGSDFYFTAEQAIAFNFVDEVFMPPAIERKPDVAIPTPAGPKLVKFTPDELFILDIVKAAKPIESTNPEIFLREIFLTLKNNIQQIEEKL